MGPLCLCSQVAVVLSSSLISFHIVPFTVLCVCRMALVLISATDLSACGILQTTSTKIGTL